MAAPVAKSVAVPMTVPVAEPMAVPVAVAVPAVPVAVCPWLCLWLSLWSSPVTAPVAAPVAAPVTAGVPAPPSLSIVAPSPAAPPILRCSPRPLARLRLRTLFFPHPRLVLVSLSHMLLLVSRRSASSPTAVPLLPSRFLPLARLTALLPLPASSRMLSHPFPSPPLLACVRTSPLLSLSSLYLCTLWTLLIYEGGPTLSSLHPTSLLRLSIKQ